MKIKKRSHAHKSHASTYNVGVLNSLNPEIHIKILNLQLEIN